MRAKWTIAFLGIAACILVLSRLPRMPANSVPLVRKSSFVADSEIGFAASIPTEYAVFMGHPLRIAVDRGGLDSRGVTPEEIDQANKVLKFLPACIPLAEQKLRDYAGSNMVSSGDDIQNPHVWLNSEREDPAGWTLVVEMKDNDGYGWHIEFAGEKFKEVWAGS